MKTKLFFLFLLSLFSVQLQAQGGKSSLVKKGIQAWTKGISAPGNLSRISSGIGAAASLPDISVGKISSRPLSDINIASLEIEQAVQFSLSKQKPPQVLSEETIREMALFDAEIRSSVFPIQQQVPEVFKIEEPFTATSFVIEEEYQGEKYLWGVTAAHIVNSMPKNTAMLVDEWVGGFPAYFDFAISGSVGMVDIALFPIPEEIALLVKPLKLASQPVKVGETLRSFGFFNKGFHRVDNRTVTEVTPGRIITTLEFDTPHRGGACGGPVLNSRNQVVGTHCGSSDGQQISFVVPAEQIAQLLRAYRQGGKETKEMFFDGLNLGEINVDEYLAKADVFSEAGEWMEYPLAKSARLIDYKNLATLPFIQKDTQKITFTLLKEDPFSLAPLRKVKITVDLQNRTVTKKVLLGE